MPIYEYVAAGEAHCGRCRKRFEVRQRMDEGPLEACPECGAPVRRLISRPFVIREEPFDEDGLLDREADGPGLDDDFDGDDDW